MTDKDECNSPLEKAVADLRAAEAEIADGERHLAKAEAEIEKAIEQEHRHKYEVEIVYDGVKKSFEVRPHETVKSLLDKATNAFGPLPNPHTLALYAGATELQDSLTLQQAGVKPCETLLLRPSKVKGGA